MLVVMTTFDEPSVEVAAEFSSASVGGVVGAGGVGVVVFVVLSVSFAFPDDGVAAVCGARAVCGAGAATSCATGASDGAGLPGWRGGILLGAFASRLEPESTVFPAIFAAKLVKGKLSVPVPLAWRTKSKKAASPIKPKTAAMVWNIFFTNY